MTLAIHDDRPNDSLLSRTDPRSKILGGIFAILATSLLFHISSLGIAFAGSLLLIGFSGMSRRDYVDQLGIVLVGLLPFLILVPFLISEGTVYWEWRWLHVTDRGLEFSLALFLRSLTIVHLCWMIVRTTRLSHLLLAAQKLYIPELFIQIALLTYRYLFMFVGELKRIRIALRLRAFRNRTSFHSYRTISQVTGTMILRSVERSEQVGHAMRCRGFVGTFHSLTELRTSTRDVLFVGILVLVAGSLLFWDRVIVS